MAVSVVVGGGAVMRAIVSAAAVNARGSELPLERGAALLPRLWLRRRRPGVLWRCWRRGPYHR